MSKASRPTMSGAGRRAPVHKNPVASVKTHLPAGQQQDPHQKHLAGLIPGPGKEKKPK